MTRKKLLNLDDLTYKLVENIENVLNNLGITVYNRYNNRIAMPCPIHGGDNDEGCTIFLKPKHGTNIVGNWRCWTHGCQEGNNTLLGFIQQVLSEDEPVSFGETISWALKYVDSVSHGQPQRTYEEYKIKGTKSREEVRKFLDIPAKYYIERGYKPEILDKYDIGLCRQKGKPMFLRVVSPVYDDNFKFVGCCGRTIQPRCSKCKLYHFENRPCPTNRIEKKWARKWMNSSGPWASHFLYNQWYATPHIYKTGTIILVEGSGDVWRAEENGIHFSLGMMKTLTTHAQDQVIKNMPVSNIIIATDNGDAGISGRERLIEKFSENYNIYNAYFEDDLGVATKEEVKDIFGPIFSKIGI